MVFPLAGRGLGAGNPLLEGQQLDHGQLYLIVVREVIPGVETDFADGRLVGSLNSLQVNEGEVLEFNQAIFEAFKILIFQDQIQNLQGSTQAIDLLTDVCLNLGLQVDEIPILCC